MKVRSIPAPGELVYSYHGEVIGIALESRKINPTSLVDRWFEVKYYSFIQNRNVIGFFND